MKCISFRPVLPFSNSNPQLQPSQRNRPRQNKQWYLWTVIFSKDKTIRDLNQLPTKTTSADTIEKKNYAYCILKRCNETYHELELSFLFVVKGSCILLSIKRFGSWWNGLQTKLYLLFLFIGVNYCNEYMSVWQVYSAFNLIFVVQWPKLSLCVVVCISIHK